MSEACDDDDDDDDDDNDILDNNDNEMSTFSREKNNGLNVLLISAQRQHGNFLRGYEILCCPPPLPLPTFF